VGIRQAVILAGGEGTRLRPLTNDVPKPMAMVNNRPFLAYLIKLLRENGISEIVLLLGYLPEKIIQHFGDGSNYGIDIKYSVGKVTDKTGARIKNAGSMLDDIFLLLYCDNYWPLNLKRLLEHYIEHKTLASTTVYTNKDGKGEYGAENNICVDNDGYVLKYDKSRKSQDLNGVDIGFFIISKRVLGLMPDHNFSFEEETLPILVDKRQLSGYQTEHRYYYISTLESLKQTERFLQPQKVIFLDRDGVINRKPADEDYVKNWSEFHFLSGAIEALGLLTKSGYDIYVITNQRGIARGMMREHDLKAIHDEMKRELEKHGAKLKQIYYCPHGQDDGCECRKPKPGLLFRAASEHNINLTKAIFIGDNDSDLQAGNAAGCKTVLVTPEKNLLNFVDSMIES
jgi:D-glycero-D-manno-heptose 1,7-bisphosphate phosphatase